MSKFFERNMVFGKSQHGFTRTDHASQTCWSSLRKCMPGMTRRKQNTMKSTIQCAKRANRVLGMIKRTVVSREKSIMLKLYKALVRPHLE